MKIEDLFSVIPSSLSNEPGYCQSGSYNLKTGEDRPSFITWESSVATPALKKAGFTDIRWRTGDGDSFGPLTRVCSCKDRDGESRTFLYG